MSIHAALDLDATVAAQRRHAPSPARAARSRSTRAGPARIMRGVFSERTAWPRVENPISRAIEAAKRRAGAALIDLTASNPTSVGLTYDAPAILRALAHEEALVYRPAPFGLPAAREAVARYYARRGLEVSAEDVIVCATTSEAYSYLFHLLADPGDTVAVPSPSYPLLSFLGDLADVTLSPYQLRHDARGGWRLDVESLAAATAGDARAIITVSPNNPTGTRATAEERRAMVGLARARGLALISDEVFLDYLRDGSTRPLASFASEAEALSFTLSGVSKIAGLPQLKLSWMVVSGPPALVAEAKGRLEIVADTFLSTSTPVQRALPALLEGAEDFQAALRARLAENERQLPALTAGSGVTPRRSDGGWYAMLDLPTPPGAEAPWDDEAWALRLAEDDGLLAHPGYLFDVDAEACLVVSLIAPPERFAAGLGRIVARATGR